VSLVVVVVSGSICRAALTFFTAACAALLVLLAKAEAADLSGVLRRPLLRLDDELVVGVELDAVVDFSKLVAAAPVCLGFPYVDMWDTRLAPEPVLVFVLPSVEFT
jgi:hypothetical protein